MKLWEKGINPEPAIIEFTAGKDRKTDLALTKWDIIGSMAHVIMLDDVRLISEEEKNGMLKALHSLFDKNPLYSFRFLTGYQNIPPGLHILQVGELRRI